LGFGLVYKVYAKVLQKNAEKNFDAEEKKKLKEAPVVAGAEGAEKSEEENDENPEEKEANKLAIQRQKSYVVRMEEGDLQSHHRDMTVTKSYGELRDTISMLSHFSELNDHLDQEFEEETRMVVHFQVLLVLAAFSNMEKETTLFQMFLRENRFKLLANGV